MISDTQHMYAEHFGSSFWYYHDSHTKMCKSSVRMTSKHTAELLCMSTAWFPTNRIVYKVLCYTIKCLGLKTLSKTFISFFHLSCMCSMIKPSLQQPRCLGLEFRLWLRELKRKTAYEAQPTLIYTHSCFDWSSTRVVITWTPFQVVKHWWEGKNS